MQRFSAASYLKDFIIGSLLVTVIMVRQTELVESEYYRAALVTVFFN